MNMKTLQDLEREIRMLLDEYDLALILEVLAFYISARYVKKD